MSFNDLSSTKNEPAKDKAGSQIQNSGNQTQTQGAAAAGEPAAQPDKTPAVAPAAEPKKEPVSEPASPKS